MLCGIISLMKGPLLPLFFKTPAVFPTPASRRWTWLMAFIAMSVPMLGFGSVLATVWFLILAPVLLWSIPSLSSVLLVSGLMAVTVVWTWGGIHLSMVALDRVAAAHVGMPCLPS